MSEISQKLLPLKTDIWVSRYNATVEKIYQHENREKWVFNEAETNCRIAHVLGIQLMISYWFAFYFSNIIVVSVQPIPRLKTNGPGF